MNKLLKPFTTNQYTAKDSFSFANDISKQDTKMFMSSLDVDSLFTNIPLKETVKICSNLLFRDNSIIDGLSKAEFEQLLTIATTESFILFNGCYYRQIDGVAMGSPLGPTLANIFLSYHEQQWLDNCPTAFRPVYYKRYVDDIFVLLPSSDCLSSFKEYLNKQHPNMHFTSEEEENNELPFPGHLCQKNSNIILHFSLQKTYIQWSLHPLFQLHSRCIQRKSGINITVPWP